MPRIQVSIGVSPAHANAYSDEIEEAIRAAKKNRYMSAIGSCGLDANGGEVQERTFARQIALAQELKLPLIVEANGAYDRALDVLLDAGMPARGVMLRAGDIGSEQLERWVEAGCYVSFGPDGIDDPVAFCNRVRLVPIERILVESGAPDAQLSVLSGTEPRCDQSVFVADIIQGICPPYQIVQNWMELFV